MIFIQRYKRGGFDFGSHGNISPWKAGFYYEERGHASSMPF